MGTGGSFFTGSITSATLTTAKSHSMKIETV